MSVRGGGGAADEGRDVIANEDLFRVVRAWVQANYPGAQAGEVLIRLNVSPRPVRLLVPGACAPPPPPAAGPQREFTPTDAQLAVLEALEGVALKTSALEEATGLEHAQLFKAMRGMRKPLMDPPLVEHDPRRGYFRTDAPPPEQPDSQ